LVCLGKEKREGDLQCVRINRWTHISVREVAIGWFLGTVVPFGQRSLAVEATPATAPYTHGSLLLITQREAVVVDKE